MPFLKEACEQTTSTELLLSDRAGIDPTRTKTHNTTVLKTNVGVNVPLKASEQSTAVKPAQNI